MFIEKSTLIETLGDRELFNIKEIEQRGQKFYNRFCFLLEANKTYTSKQIAQIAMNFSNSDQTRLEASLFYHFNQNKTYKFNYHKGLIIKEQGFASKANSLLIYMKAFIGRKIGLSL